jgi:hypothetical protein
VIFYDIKVEILSLNSDSTVYLPFQLNILRVRPHLLNDNLSHT